MNRRSIFPVLGIALLFLLVLNLGISRWSSRLPYRIKLDQIRTSQNPNLLFVGNSLLDGRVDGDAIASVSTAVPLRPLNAALGATNSPEHLLLFDYATRIHPGIRTLVIGFFDLGLTSGETDHVMSLTGNRILGFDSRFSPREVADAYRFGPADRIELAMLRRFPLVANRANIWKYVELLRRHMGTMGMPSVATNSMGNVGDFSALEASSPSSFDTQIASYLAHPGSFNPSYETIAEHARANGIQVVLVAMPMSPSHWNAFYSRPSWNRYLETIQSIATRRGFRFIDASGWMPSEDKFVDHLHMSHAAAHEFSLRIGHQIDDMQ
jgi:hypothetical protein